jgi:hypothetical protein
MKTVKGQRWRYQFSGLDFVVELISDLRPGKYFLNQVDGKILRDDNNCSLGFNSIYRAGTIHHGFTPFPTSTTTEIETDETLGSWKYLLGQDAV